MAFLLSLNDHYSEQPMGGIKKRGFGKLLK